MTELNREEIIKALECCTSGKPCRECEYKDKGKDTFGCRKKCLIDALSLITSQEQRIKELTEEVESLKQAMEHEHASFMEIFGEYGEKCERLTEENERLRGILLQFTDIVHKWGNKNGYDTSEISLVPILNEENTIKSQIEADTVRKMQERLKERFSTASRYTKYSGAGVVMVIDQIAKEMLNEKGDEGK